MQNARAVASPVALDAPAIGALDWIQLLKEARDAQTFWGHLLQTLGQATCARRLVLLTGTVGKPWQALAQWPAQAQLRDSDAATVQNLVAQLDSDRARTQHDASGERVLALRLPVGPMPDAHVMALVVLGAPDQADVLHRLWASLLASVPAGYMQTQDRAAALAEDKHSAPQVDMAHTERLHGWMQLAARVWQHDHFVHQAFDLCGEVSKRLGCERVSLGWRHGRLLRLKAISQVEKFDARSAAVRALESAMEEAADQPADTVFPAREGDVQVVFAHDSYAALQGTAHLLSVPFWVDGEAVGVLTLERQAAAFSDDERWELGEFAAWVATPLAQLAHRHRWWGARLGLRARRWAALAVGPRHTSLKLGLLTGSALLLASVLTPWDYRVDAKVLVRSEDVLFMPAPFDGYLSAVHVEVGEAVRQGQVLAELDQRDLLLEASMAEADALRYAREAEKAQAARQFADMQITWARQAQSQSRLALVRHQLAQAKVVAPHDGVIVEGDLKKNLGAPLHKGDLLLKLAQTRQLVLELAIDEADVHELAEDASGEMALVGRPDQHFDIRLQRVDPVSTLQDGKNVFLARAQTSGTAPDWWRPGMGGTARLWVGTRSLLWVVTHRSVRFLRQVFWV